MNKSITRAYPDLKTWRKAQRISQRKAAILLGMSQSSYSRLERRVRAIKGAPAKALMVRTGVPLEVIVGAA